MDVLDFVPSAFRAVDVELGRSRLQTFHSLNVLRFFAIRESVP